MGLVTSYLVYKSVSKPAVQQAETEDVLVANANIAIGEALTPNHVKVAPWPKGTVVPGSLKTVKDIEGRVAKSSIVAGEPVLDSKLTPPGGGGLMPVLVPAGKRAISIVVEQAVQKSGFVVPNSRVDVLVTMAPTGSATKQSRIVLQDITILAADQTVEMKDNKPVTMTTVTMALAPEEAERLALAQNEGRVTLALRNIQDTDRVTTSGVTTAQLMGSPAPVPASAKRSPSASPSGSGTKKARKAGRPAPAAQPAPVAAQPAPTVQPAPHPTHRVAVIRGTAVAEETFVQDPDRGWVEAPKGGAAKKAQ
jgi:pilus assembly protein CpaB